MNNDIIILTIEIYIAGVKNWTGFVTVWETRAGQRCKGQRIPVIQENLTGKRKLVTKFVEFLHEQV